MAPLSAAVFTNALPMRDRRANIIKPASITPPLFFTAHCEPQSATECFRTRESLRNTISASYPLFARESLGAIEAIQHPQTAFFS